MQNPDFMRLSGISRKLMKMTESAENTHTIKKIKKIKKISEKVLTSDKIHYIIAKQVETGKNKNDSIKQIWNLSSAGRASALQAEGHRFEPYRFHILKENGEIAQLARAHGSYPWCRGFESPSRYYTKDESVNRVKGLQAFLCYRHIHTKIYKISFYYCHNPQNPL